MHPLVHMNSRYFFSLMLSVSEGYREDEKMLTDLLKNNNADLMSVEINKKDSIAKELLRRLYLKLQ